MPALLIGPLGKVLGIGLLILALIGIGEWHGRQAVQEAWDAAVARQAMDAAETVIRAAENTARIESDFQKRLDAQAARVKVVTKEVKVYVESPAKKCELSPEFERVFDAVSGLHHASADSVPAAADAPGAAAVLPQTPVTDAEILQVHQLSAVELANLWDTYSALRDWVRSSHAIAREGAGR